MLGVLGSAVIIFLSYRFLLLNILYSTTATSNYLQKYDKKSIEEHLLPLQNSCIENSFSSEWWTYDICFGHHIQQRHYDLESNQLIASNDLGSFIASESLATHQIYRTNQDDTSCSESENGVVTVENSNRYSEIVFECCQHREDVIRNSRKYPFQKKKAQMYRNVDATIESTTYIESVREPIPCTYYVTICSDLICKPGQDLDTEMPNHNQQAATSKPVIDDSKKEKTPKVRPVKSKINDIYKPIPIDSIPSSDEQKKLLGRARAMFYHAYDSYMLNSYPEAELKPITCEGGKFDLIKLPLVTLIDTLDTLVIIGNYSEFRRAIGLVVQEILNFNYDVNVSVFETTIRVLGGLLSAHLMAVDPRLGIYKVDHNTSLDQNYTRPYRGELLALAIDLGDRLLPAFHTKTSIPFGTVNLRYGVPNGETKIASTAGAGSLVIEFEVLSYLSGRKEFGEAAHLATHALYSRRSNIGLLGKHINTETGVWHESLSGIGSNSDSFYEYLLKAYFLFRRQEYYGMFAETYRAIKKFVQVDHWFTEVDMFSGNKQRNRVENLDAFWPGVEALLGFSEHGAGQLNSFYSVWADVGFLPEEFDYLQWQLGNGVSSSYFPLRPELIESTYHHYRTTGDRSWLAAGKLFLESFEKHSRTECGYAAISNLANMELHNSMPSFFLSETCKYLILLFDENNFIHSRPYIFSTEAHPFDSIQLHELDTRLSLLDNKYKQSDSNEASSHAEESSDDNNLNNNQAIDQPKYHNKFKKRKSNDNNNEMTNYMEHAGATGDDHDGHKHDKMLPLKCRKRIWWDESTAYNSEFYADTNKRLREESTQKNSNVKKLVDEKLESFVKAIHRNRKKSNNKNNDKNDKKSSNKKNDGAKQSNGNRMKSNNNKSSHSNNNNNIKYEEMMVGMDGQLTSYLESNEHDYIQYKRLLLDERLENRAPKQWFDLLSLIVDEYYNVQTKYSDSNSISQGHHNSHNQDKLISSRTKEYLANEIESNRYDDNDNSETNDLISNKNKIRRNNRKRSDTCYKEEEPKPTAAREQSTNEPQKVVEVNMGAIGDFTVKVYVDGFHIYNKVLGDAIEINSVGKSQLLVRDYDNKPGSIGVVARGDITSQVVSYCSVKISAIQNNDNIQSDDTDDKSEGTRVIWERPCALSNFGPIGPNYQISGSLVVPVDDGMMCDDTSLADDSMQSKWRWWQWSSHGKSNQNNNNKTPASSLPYKNKIVLAKRGVCLFEEKSINSFKAGASGLIVINTEDQVFLMAGKKEVAALEGEVLPNDNNEFIPLVQSLLGIKTKQIRTENEDVVNHLSEKCIAKDRYGGGRNENIQAGSCDQNDNYIPTVMLSAADGKSLEEILASSTSSPLEYNYHININSHPSLLFNNVLMGFNERNDASSNHNNRDDLPKVYMSPHTIVILGRGSWGVLITTNNMNNNNANKEKDKQEEWQLYLMDKKELVNNHAELIPPITIRTTTTHTDTGTANEDNNDNNNNNNNNLSEEKCMSHKMLSNPVELYYYYTARKCPHIIDHIRSDGQVVIKQ
eukprot:gene8658-11701_t